MSASKSDGPANWPTNREMMERNSGYQEIMNRPEIRNRISEYILRAATPELIAYTAIDDRIGEEFNFHCKTACRFLLGSRTKIVQFVFENLIKEDPAYIQFISHRGFRDTYLETLKKHNAHPQNYSEDNVQKAKDVAADMKQHFALDAFLFTKFFLADNKTNAQVLAAVQSEN